jgi:hypothetical protein
MVVLDELRDRDAEVAFTERNELVEALRLDGEHEAFRDCVRRSSQLHTERAIRGRSFGSRTRFIRCMAASSSWWIDGKHGVRTASTIRMAGS